VPLVKVTSWLRQDSRIELLKEWQRQGLDLELFLLDLEGQINLRPMFPCSRQSFGINLEVHVDNYSRKGTLNDLTGLHLGISWWCSDLVIYSIDLFFLESRINLPPMLPMLYHCALDKVFEIDLAAHVDNCSQKES
jgi:hypothetical protein